MTQVGIAPEWGDPNRSTRLSRRELRASRSARGSLGRIKRTAAAPAHASEAAPAVAAPAMTTADSRPPRKRGGVVKNVAVLTLAAGIVATIALPAYAMSSSADQSAVGIAQVAGKAQNVVVAANASGQTVTHDAFTATAPPPPVQVARVAARKAMTAYQGPTAADFLANPPYPSYDPSKLVQVALQYQGVPYVFGGATPAGFDCSGFTMFVFAQFGISLPHSASRQGANGAKIAPADAMPGDLVIMDGGNHVGIYLGNGNMIDAPMPGRVVNVRPIYTPNHYFVRYGI